MAGNKETTVDVKSVCAACGEVAVTEVKGVAAMGGMTTERGAAGMSPLPGRVPGQWMEPDGAGFIANRKKAKKRRLRAFTATPALWPKGTKLEMAKTGEPDGLEEKALDDIVDSVYLCGLDRKIHPVTEPCTECPGGCLSEKGLPELIEVEGWAEMLYDAKTVDSGYGSLADLFIVQLERKDGRFIEAIFDGETAEPLGWTMLNPDVLTEKTTEGIRPAIGIDEAAQVALSVKTLEDGTVGNVEADTWDGVDAWVVEVTKSDGSLHDVYVSLAGDVLGWDSYDMDEKSDTPADGNDENASDTNEDSEEEPTDKETKDEASDTDEKSELIPADEEMLAALRELGLA